MSAVGAPVRTWLRLEALAVTAAGLLVWSGMDGGWARLALLVLIPDLSLIGYVWGPRTGAAAYNAAHSYALPLALAMAGGALDHRMLVLTGTLWIIHIGVDRTLGYGLKYATGFHDTHLGRLGARAFKSPALVQTALANTAAPKSVIPQSVLRTGEHLVQFLNPPEGKQPLAR